MNRECPVAIHCGDYPFVNLSSEGPEVDWRPPPGIYWTASGYCCEGTLKTVWSTVSQDDADQTLQRTLAQACPTCPPDFLYCADAACPDGSNLTKICVPTSQADADALADAAALAMEPYCGDLTQLYQANCACPDGVTDPHTTYSNVSQAVADSQCDAIPKSCGGAQCNDEQCCTVFCSDASTFTYCVPAGTYCADTKEEANAIARSFACLQANTHKICLTALSSDSICLGTSASVTASLTGGTTGCSWQIISGSIPTGMTLSSSGCVVTISGTPTEAGTFTFALRVTDSNGSYMQKTYTLTVVGITTSSPLDAGTVGSDYDEQLASAGATNYQYTITAGALPDGLNMDADGHITGTPTLAGTYDFTVQVEAT